ncbi:unnamed protein product [Adineta ricciae]|uniref:Uncharacterized protein n=1 Tax=Adineta ricciae TaxID=249248 RepID=A0A814EE08_ADIRI|nr:unnamed protein product [Adineta ricciae]
MADDKSPLVRDIRISDAVICDKNQDILSRMDMTDIDMDAETTFRFTACDSQSTGISNYHYIVDSHDYSCLSISFSNPPGPIYHVRYLSEITNSPLDGNIVHTKKKTKKNISGRYLKGEQKRHVTINLPLNLFDYNEYYIRVTRLTVPYQNCSFIHPYPLLYSPPKRRTLSVITEEKEWIYFKLTREDLCSHSKQFPNLILTRIKQSELKAMHTLKLYDDHLVTCTFEGDTPKKKIALYQLKKSQLDFRLVMRCPQTGGFIDLHASCRSRELLEGLINESNGSCFLLFILYGLENLPYALATNICKN